MSKLEELGECLFGDPKTAIHDIKFDQGTDQNIPMDEIAGTILAAIRDVRAGNGKDIDLSF